MINCSIYNQDNVIVINDPDQNNVPNAESDRMIVVYSILSWVALMGISTTVVLIIKYHS